MRSADKNIAMKKANIEFNNRSKANNINENIEGFKKPVEDTPTMVKLINTAIKDGYITKNEISAQYIMSAAKEIAKNWDALHSEEKKALRNKYYMLFLSKIGKK
jgi:isocitrate dehydrogenase